MFLSMALFALIGTTITLPSTSAFNAQYFRKPEPLRPNTIQNFSQLKNHLDPSAGKFEQRYYFSDEHYKGQGSPIVISTPGEQDADGFDSFLTRASLMNEMLKRFGAAGVVLEHRYWGSSWPVDKASGNFGLLTVNQAIDDYKYFIENVNLPWTRGSGSYNSKPSVTPWVNLGCSYPGQLVTLVQEKYPDLFAAGYATSAPLNASGDFWEYWKPIEAAMPKNCASDLTTAMTHMDQVMSMVKQDEADALKEKFGLKGLSNYHFAEKLKYPFTEWQEAKPDDTSRNVVLKFCDTIEGSNTSAQGIGMPQALENWAKEFKNLCPHGTCPRRIKANSNPYSEMHTNTPGVISNQWEWLLCTQLGWFQPGTNPSKVPSIVSRQIKPANYESYCNQQFPLPNGATHDLFKAAAAFNAEFKSWNVVGKNLYTVNGEFDPWRPLSLSHDWAPPSVNTATQKVSVIRGGVHCWDLWWSYGDNNPNVRAVQLDGIQQIRSWLNDWYKSHPSVVNPVPAMRVQTIGEAYGINETQEAVLNNLEEKVNDLSTKTLTRTSYGLNGVLALSAIVALVFFVITKRAKAKSSSIPRWSTENAGGIPQRELGEKYQHLKHQTV